MNFLRHSWGSTAGRKGVHPSCTWRCLRDILNNSVLDSPDYRAEVGQCPRFSYPTFSDCSANYSGTAKRSPLQPAFHSGVSSAFGMLER
ncbi:hypothetical protein Y032_0010g1069 [Ancylostoma ceylanicum]|uniref:Uncharacterized protein n=1 Tax=Ancylostoma ceylanicum TaxID=53326 RepID=A0A016VFU1_9BILA|nr:hypothetical protein Y032_0010g1069 [Ancylostoma ceylanicum]